MSLGPKGLSLTAFPPGARELADEVVAVLILVESVLDIKRNVFIVLGRVLRLDYIVTSRPVTQVLGPGNFRGGTFRVLGIRGDLEDVVGLDGSHIDGEFEARGESGMR